MIGLIGIFVITSSACFTCVTDSGFKYNKIYLTHFIRISNSSSTRVGEKAQPVCDWIGHKWKLFYLDGNEANQCLYCDKKRVRKEVWEEVK